MAVARDQLGLLCDEGGQHVFKAHATCCDWLTFVFCLPCYACASCMCAAGTATGNNPALQQCCGQTGDGDETHCVKCGLTLDEAQALNEARRDELAGRGKLEPGHFTANGDAAELAIPQGVALPPSRQRPMSQNPQERPVSHRPRPHSQLPA